MYGDCSNYVTVKYTQILRRSICCLMIAKVLMTEVSKLATKFSKPWACRKKTSTKLLATLESPLVEKR